MDPKASGHGGKRKDAGRKSDAEKATAEETLKKVTEYRGKLTEVTQAYFDAKAQVFSASGRANTALMIRQRGLAEIEKRKHIGEVE